MKRIYDPCFNCSNSRIGGFCSECIGDCLYAQMGKQHEHKVGRLIDKLECWELAYRKSGDTKTASVIESILVSTRAIFGQ